MPQTLAAFLPFTVCSLFFSVVNFMNITHLFLVLFLVGLLQASLVLRIAIGRCRIEPPSAFHRFLRSLTIMTSQKRVAKVCGKAGSGIYADRFQELGELATNPPSGITVELADEKDLYVWKALMQGPADSPYAVSIRLSDMIALGHPLLQFPALSVPHEVYELRESALLRQYSPSISILPSPELIPDTDY